MKTMRPTFEQTIDKLVKAYLNDELLHGDCEACVVGNLLDGWGNWQRIFFTPSDDDDKPLQQLITDEGEILDIIPLHGWKVCSVDDYANYREEIVARMEACGYTVKELAKIENTFELAVGKDKEERMFNGLMAVTDVLADIHGVDLQVKEKAKSLFVQS